MHFHVITLFPEIIKSYTSESILARAIKNKKIKVTTYNPRDFAKGKLQKKWPDGNVTTYVDDRPYGGGPGMVLRAEPIIGAIDKALGKNKGTVILTTPGGKQFSNTDAEKLKKEKNIVIVCGRYEGVDSRVMKVLKTCLPAGRAKEYSVGPYVVTGGEIPALIMIDAISRRVPGVLNKQESLEENRVSSSEIYTRPEVLEYKKRKYKVPEVLLSGHQAKIEEWKRRGKKN
ncbi:MAG: tRNA (guanosine(37)-N1)-methyltransferase TrmD [Patescibacteria group bacterium]